MAMTMRNRGEEAEEGRDRDNVGGVVVPQGSGRERSRFGVEVGEVRKGGRTAAREQGEEMLSGGICWVWWRAGCRQLTCTNYEPHSQGSQRDVGFLVHGGSKVFV